MIRSRRKRTGAGAGAEAGAAAGAGARARKGGWTRSSRGKGKEQEAVIQQQKKSLAAFLAAGEDLGRCSGSGWGVSATAAEGGEGGVGSKTGV